MPVTVIWDKLDQVGWKPLTRLLQANSVQAHQLEQLNVLVDEEGRIKLEKVLSSTRD
jgi:hypothetical protein